MKNLLIISGLLLSALACKTTKNATTNEQKDMTQTPVKDVEKCNSVITDADRFSAGQTDPYTLKNAWMDGRYLMAEVEYGGGCGGATFDLVWNGMLMKSMPPKANVAILLKDEDYCKALVTDTLCFDVSSVYKGECIFLLKDFRGVLQYKP